MSLQEDIIAQLGVKPVIDPQEEIRRSIDFLKDYLQKALLLPLPSFHSLPTLLKNLSLILPL